MIERFVYLKLLPEHSDTPTIRTLTHDVLAVFPTYPGVASVRVLHPADDAASKAWDLCLHVSFESLQDYDLYAKHPAHLTFIKERLIPVSAARKAWNFQASTGTS